MNENGALTANVTAIGEKAPKNGPKLYGAAAQPMGSKIVALRRHFGWTQSDLSKRVGCTFDYISKLERGEHEPGLELFASLASAFGVTMDAPYDWPTERLLQAIELLTRHTNGPPTRHPASSLAPRPYDDTGARPIDDRPRDEYGDLLPLAVLKAGDISWPTGLPSVDWPAAHPDARGYIVVTEDPDAFRQRKIGGIFYLVNDGVACHVLAIDACPRSFALQYAQKYDALPSPKRPTRKHPTHAECQTCICRRRPKWIRETLMD